MERNPPRLHVAILDEELPYPLTSGKRIRTYHLLSRLAARHRLTYLCHRNPDLAESSLAEEEFRKLGIRTIVVDRRVPPKSGLGFYARLFANLFSGLPYSVASHHSAELQAAVELLQKDDPPDLWHCEWTPYAEYCRRMNRPWVVMAHNVESLIWQRYRETEANPLKRWYIARQERKFEHFERWAYSNCTRPIAVSEEDATLIRNRFGAKIVDVVDNGVDPDFFAEESVPRQPRTLLFLGSLDWRPNLDAAAWLLDVLFPLVRRSEPDAKLQFVGRKPAAWLRQRASTDSGVELHADVADVRPFLRSAGMLIVPLRIGGGSRLKILEALAAGVPVVTTTIGVEGLRLRHGQHVTIADEPDAIARAVFETILDHPRALQMAENGRALVSAEYDWAILAERLESVWLKNRQVG